MKSDIYSYSAVISFPTLIPIGYRDDYANDSETVSTENYRLSGLKPTGTNVT